MKPYKVNMMDLYDKVYEVWKVSSDKESVEKTFELLTGGMKLENIFKTLRYIGVK